MGEPLNNTVKVIDSKGYLHIRLVKKQTSETILNAVKNVISNATRWSSKPRIYDISEADISDIDCDSLLKLTRTLMKTNNMEFKSRRVVIVSEKNLNLCTANLFKEFYTESDIRLAVFDSLKKAEQWVYES